MFLQEGAILSIASLVAVQRTIAYLRNDGRPLTFEGPLVGAVMPPTSAVDLNRTNVTVSSLPEHTRDEVVVIPIRWTVLDGAGQPIPCLDANLEIGPVEDSSTRFTIVGSYSAMPTPESLAATRAVTVRVGRLAIREFLARLTRAVSGRPEPDCAPEQQLVRHPGQST
jgi:hypothetical protein